jgi:regulator of replication initiation timing
VTPAVPQHLLEEISLVLHHRDEVWEPQCAMNNVEEENQALRMEVCRLREELSSTVYTSHMHDLKKELHELR